MARQINDASVIVGVARLGEMFGRSRWWARAMLEEWLTEQRAGGPIRVQERGKRLFTTLGVIQRELPAARDQVVVRKLKEHERDLNMLARRIDDLTTQVRNLSKKIEPQSGRRITA